jgi:hypothetical protein
LNKNCSPDYGPMCTIKDLQQELVRCFHHSCNESRREDFDYGQLVLPKLKLNVPNLTPQETLKINKNESQIKRILNKDSLKYCETSFGQC